MRLRDFHFYLHTQEALVHPPRFGSWVGFEVLTLFFEVNALDHSASKAQTPITHDLCTGKCFEWNAV